MQIITIKQIHFSSTNRSWNILLNFLNQNSSAKYVGIDRIQKISKNTFSITKNGIDEIYNFVGSNRTNNLNIENELKCRSNICRTTDVKFVFDKQYHSPEHITKMLTGLEQYDEVYYLFQGGLKSVTKHLRYVKDYLDVARNRNLPEGMNPTYWQLSYHVPSIIEAKETTIEKKLKDIEYHKRQIQYLETEIANLRKVV